MLQNIFKKFLSALILLVAFFPSDLKAQIFTGEEREPTDEALPDAQRGVQEIGEALAPTGVAGTADFGQLILKYVNFALPFLALAAFVGFIYAGFLYVTAYGNDEQVQKSKKILIYVVVGLILVILSFSIVQLLTETLPAGIQ